MGCGTSADAVWCVFVCDLSDCLLLYAIVCSTNLWCSLRVCGSCIGVLIYVLDSFCFKLSHRWWITPNLTAQNTNTHTHTQHTTFIGMLVALHPGERGTGQGGISRKRLLTCFNPLSMLDNPHRTTIHNTTRHHQTGATDNNINTHNPHNHPNQNKIRSSAINYRARLLTCFYSTVAPELEQGEGCWGM